LDRRIGERQILTTEIEASQRQRNTPGDRIEWKFTTQKAQDRLDKVVRRGKDRRKCRPSP